MNEKKLKARDFITIGIFTAILWVVQISDFCPRLSSPAMRFSSRLSLVFR